jgi:antitoxin component YwqK of YwqJK toxin-antitoxin module
MKRIIKWSSSGKYILFLVVIAVVTIACNRIKTTAEVKATYADGKAKKVDEYTTDDKGNKILYKETYYFPGEKKYVSGTYNNSQERNGVWSSWYKNGQKNSEQNYINGKEDGKYRVWHPNGKPYIKGQYEMGEKTGTWSFHDFLGKVINEVSFEKK